jgi:hypothetical protein
MAGAFMWPLRFAEYPRRFGSQVHSLPLIGARALLRPQEANKKNAQKHHVNSATCRLA